MNKLPPLISPPPWQEAGLRARLLQRVALSASAHRAFVTVRQQAQGWHAFQPGVQCRELHADEEARTCLLAWRDDDAAGSLPTGPHLQELLVLSGQVLANGQAMQAHDYLLCQADVAVHLQATAGTRLYWRRIGSVVQAFGHAAPETLLVRANELAWEPLRQGVRIKPFYGEADRISMLVHFEPGARVPSHSHAHGEACLMVEGDLFLGDVLLCQGDFQFAPRGTGHGELHSDVGCLLFFHGAVDPAVLAPD